MFIKNFLSWIRRYILNGDFRRNVRYAQYYNNLKINGNLILYESSRGAGIICNPYAIFKTFLEYDEFDDFDHVWSLDSIEPNKTIINEYKKLNNVKFVKRNSRDYLKLLATAKYLINNTSFPRYFSKKSEQIYLNTWHSVTVKSLGYDLVNGYESSTNMVRNFLSANYILTQNKFMSDVLTNSFKLDRLFKGEILEIGQPRNELLNDSRDEVFKKLMEASSDIRNFKESEKVVLFAPTWRGNNYLEPEYDLSLLTTQLDIIIKNFIGTNYRLLFKPHAALYVKLKELRGRIPFEIVPSNIDTNELLTIVDVLITDYSSIYFDYIPLKKPIVFFLPDLEDYKNERGLELSVEHLPGPITTNIQEVGQLVLDSDKWFHKYKGAMEEVLKWLNNNKLSSEQKVSKEVINKVLFSTNETSNRNKKSGKKAILFYALDFRMNGVTTSFLSLLKNIDYEKYDISIVLPIIYSKTQQDLVAQINPRVRIVYRKFMPSISTFLEMLSYNIFIYNKIIKLKKMPKSVTRMFTREFRRLFGDSSFDFVIDFSGYGPWYFLLLQQAQSAKKIVWQHNDLLSDLRKNVSKDKRRNLAREMGLSKVISLYSQVDKVVSCSSEVLKVNKENLANDDTIKKFTYVSNTVDPYRIKSGLNQELDEKLSELVSKFKNKFVSVGRLSEEKNYDNLIKGFSLLVKENIDSALFIIGDGVEKENLQKLINEEQLEANVFLLGILANPFKFMSMCDCFVLASKYEGQGLVLIEARTLGLPIITTNFDAVWESIDPSIQKVVNMDYRSLYLGMKDFVDGKVEGDRFFSLEEYNAKGIKEFNEMLDSLN